MKNKVDKKTKIWSVTLIVVASLLIIFAFCGHYFNSWLKHVANFFVGSFGMSFYGLMAAIIVFASFALAGKKVKVPAKYLVHFALLFVTVVLFVHTLTTQFLKGDDGRLYDFATYAKYVYNYYSGVPTFGGIVFGSIAYALQSVISIVGAIIVYVGLLVGSVFMIGDFFYCLSTGKIDLTKESDNIVTATDDVPSKTTQTVTNPTSVSTSYAENTQDNSRSARDNAMRILFSRTTEQSVNPVQVSGTPVGQQQSQQQFDVARQSINDTASTNLGGTDYDSAMRTLFPKEVVDKTVNRNNGGTTDNNVGGGNDFFNSNGLEVTPPTAATNNTTNNGGFFSPYQTTPSQQTNTPSSWQTEPTQNGSTAPAQTGGYYPAVQQTTTSSTTSQDNNSEESWRIRTTTSTNDANNSSDGHRVTSADTTNTSNQPSYNVSSGRQYDSTQHVQNNYTSNAMQNTSSNYEPDVLDVLADSDNDYPTSTKQTSRTDYTSETGGNNGLSDNDYHDTTSQTDVQEDGGNDVDEQALKGRPVAMPAQTTVEQVAPQVTQTAHAATNNTANGTSDNGKNDSTDGQKPVHRFAEYVKPPFDLLEAPEPVVDEEAGDREAAAEAIVKKLAVFNIQVELVNIIVGPAFSRYMFRVLSQKTRMSDFAKYSDDIKGCLEAPENIRIIAPVLGTNLVGVEVANKKKSKVALRSIIESPDFQNAKGALCFAVGQEISGKVVWKDLAKMPHLLIAGQTGSGKSVCVNCLIVSMLYKYGPEYVRFLMVDPKLVELSRYNGIPHMLTSETITIVNDALAGMDYLINEMESRYQLFRAAGVGDIGEYNKRINPAEKQRLPYLVLIVDELADLMSQAKQAFENKIGRLAAKARAAGIHIVLATQRPDTKVITGTIKNNLTARIALTVPTAIDSGTILGSGGAEKLLGRGDMLFSDPSAQELERVQGAYVDNDEIRNVVEFSREQNESYFDEAASKEIFVTAAQEEAAEREAQQAAEAAANKENAVDPYCKKALRFWLEKNAGKASIASIQRSLGIGFNRAGRIMSQLQNLKYVDEPAPSESNSKPMKVLVTLDQLDDLFPDLED